MYQAWCLDTSAICIETLWNKWEEFCMWQANELRVKYHILKSFSQAESSIDECLTKSRKTSFIWLSLGNFKYHFKRHISVWFTKHRDLSICLKPAPTGYQLE